MQDLIINYNDACIYKSDIGLLESRSEWLNDACINYQMRRLEKIRQEQNDQNDQGTNSTSASTSASASTSSCSNTNGTDGCTSSTTISNVEFLDPSVVSFFMHQLSIQDEDDHDEMISLCRSWGLDGFCSSCVSGNGNDNDNVNDDIENNNEKTSKLILIPINDNYSATAMSFQTPGGGNHWSLLVLLVLPPPPSPPEITTNENKNDCMQIYFHFDSANGCNTSTASFVAHKIHSMSNITTTTTTTTTISQDTNDTIKEDKQIIRKDDGNGIHVIECDVPRQQNGYDCGIHTLATAGIIGSMTNLTIIDNNKTDTNINTSSGDYYSMLSNDIKVQFETVVEDFVLKYDTVTDMSQSLRKSIANDIKKMAAYGR